MQLPANEENNEQVVRVPEPLEMSTATFLQSEPHHDAKSGGHDPSGSTRACSKVGGEEGDDTLAGRLRIGIGHGELGKVHHVSDNVDGRTNDN